MLYVVLLASLGFCVARLLKTPQVGGLRRADIFKDLAHIWVGFVLALAIASNSSYWWMFGLLCVTEVIAVIAGLWR